MREIVIDGVTYSKASEVAKQFRYTKDYIGQLCRSGKVDAKLVGRTWFVNPESLTVHKKQRYQKSSPQGKDIPQSENTHTEGTAVTKPSISSPADRGVPKQFLRRIGWNTVSYEPDDAELIPNVTKATTAVTLSVDPAEAERMTVKTKDSSTKLAPTKLPTVSLNGTLRVASLDTYYDVSEEEDDELADDAAVSSRRQLINPYGQLAMRRRVSNKPALERDKRKVLLKRDNYKNKDFLDKLSRKQVFSQTRSGAVADAMVLASRRQNSLKLAASAKLDDVTELVQGGRGSKDEKQPIVAGKQPPVFESSQDVPVATLNPAEAQPVVVTSYRLVHLSLLISIAVLFTLLSLNSRVVSSTAGTAATIEFSFANVSSWFTRE